MKAIEELAAQASTAVGNITKVASLLPSQFNFHLMDGSTAVGHEEAKALLASVFIRLGKMVPNLFPLVKLFSEGRVKALGVSIETVGANNYIVPSINFNSFNCVKCEFTSMVRSEVAIKNQQATRTNYEATVLRNLMAKSKVGTEAVAELIKHGTLYIGSIGSRKTNRSTEYSIEFKNVYTDDCLTLLTPLIDIVGIQNKGRKTGYVLTCFSEVVQFMDALGLKEWFNAQRNLVKDYERQNKLLELYKDEGSHLPDYRSCRFEIVVPLTEASTSMGHYPNGEPIVTPSIQQEAWYPDYESMERLCVSCRDENQLFQAFAEDYKRVHLCEFDEEFAERAHKWAKYLMLKREAAA